MSFHNFQLNWRRPMLELIGLKFLFKYCTYLSLRLELPWNPTVLRLSLKLPLAWEKSAIDHNTSSLNICISPVSLVASLLILQRRCKCPIFVSASLLSLSLFPSPVHSPFFLIIFSRLLLPARAKERNVRNKIILKLQLDFFPPTLFQKAPKRTPLTIK